MGAISLVVSLGLFWYARRSRRGPRFLLNLGLVYEVLIALSIGLLDWAYNPPMGLSWIAIIILIFAAIIPAPPAKTLVVALLAASMDPVGALIWKAAGQQHVPGAGEVFLHAFPNYLCALIAPLISHIITGLGREVRKAREMGSYVLGDLIGAGGMGEVWQATHRFLARPAAIKLIKPEVLGAMTQEQGDVLVQRFRREAQAAAMLRSPHTIQLYDFGVTSDGTFYYVMELLNGMDLQTLVTRHGPLPPARAIYLLQQACESLAEAHERGLVHRDIKPGNIQVCRMGEYSDWVKVLDFGLVKSQGGEVLEPGLTAPHMRHRHAGLSLTRERAGGAGGPADRHLRPGLRRLLDADRAVRVHRRQRDADRGSARLLRAGPAVPAQRVRCFSGARPAGPRLPGEEAGRPSGNGAGAVRPAGRVRGGVGLDPGGREKWWETITHAASPVMAGRSVGAHLGPNLVQ